jgi:glycosyltransferase involved in cell wall biosynthesis
MKIAYLITSTIPSRIANSIHAMQICNALTSLGHQVTLLVPDKKDIEKVDDVRAFYGVEHHFTIKKLLYPALKGKMAFFAFHAAKEVRRIKPDLVIGRSVHACALSAMMGFPTVFDSHGPIWESDPITIKTFRVMLNRRSFKQMTVNSGALKKMYQASDVFKGTSYSPDNIVVAYNGSKQFDLEEKVALPGDAGKPKIGYFGHLYKGRGIELIIDIAAAFPEVNFYLVGGEETDIKYWRENTALPNVYVIGYVPYASVYKYRNSVDVLLAPYQRVVAPEGHQGDQAAYMNPIKILEYLSSKKPIISSELATIKEVLNDGNSVLVDCEDITQWKSALQKLLIDKSFADSIAQQAYHDFLNNYTWVSRAKKMIPANL